MERTRISAALALVLAALLLALNACGGSSADSAFSGEAAPGGAAGDGWYDQDVSYDKPQEDGGAPQAGAKIIYTADLSLETTEFDTAVQSLDHIVQGLGGWFESRSIDQGGTYRSLRCTIRAPAESFTALLDQAGQAAHMTYRQEYQEDVSESYYDTDARLTTQRTKLQRLQELLSQAQDMADIITLESAISDTELEIEYLTGSLRHYDSLVGYATVTVSLREVYRLSTDEAPAVTFGQRMAAAFSGGLRNSLEALEDLAVFLAGNWLGLLVLALAAGAAVWLVRRAAARRRQRRTPPPPPADKEA